jgi:hypothetical protein
MRKAEWSEHHADSTAESEHPSPPSQCEQKPHACTVFDPQHVLTGTVAGLGTWQAIPSARLSESFL